MAFDNPLEQFDPSNPQSSIKGNLILEIIAFIMIWLFASILGASLAQFYGEIAGVSDVPNLLKQFEKGALLEHVSTLKVMSIISHLFQYLFPVLIFVGWIYTKQKSAFLLIDKPPQTSNMFYSLLLIITIHPFISFVYYWNTHLLPDSAIAKDLLNLQALFLDMKGVGDLCLNLLLLGLVAGIGEEFFFRGVVQQFITRWTKNIHLGAIGTGFLFSLMHFQLEGFLPRMLLGTFFCYLLIFTGNLWITTIIHIFFNSIQVILPYFYPKFLGNINEIQEVHFGIAALSLALFMLLFSFFIRNNLNNKYIYLRFIK